MNKNLNLSQVKSLFPVDYHCLFDFKTDGDQSDLAMDEAAVQKRLWMIQIAEQYKFKQGLDLFAGVGYGAYIMTQCCKNVLAIEKDEVKFALLKENLQNVDGAWYLKDDNRAFLELETGQRFDYIDFDPFNNANEHLQYLPHLFNDGLIWITSGEIQLVYRNLPGLADCFKDKARFYTGKKAVDWPENVYFPYIADRYNLNLVDFYIYPTSVRSLWTREKYKNKIKLTGQRYLGWFKELKREGLF